MKLDELLGKHVHVQLMQPAHLQCDVSVVMVVAVDATVWEIASGFVTFVAERVYYLHEDAVKGMSLIKPVTFMYPIKSLGSVQVLTS